MLDIDHATPTADSRQLIDLKTWTDLQGRSTIGGAKNFSGYNLERYRVCTKDKDLPGKYFSWQDTEKAITGNYIAVHTPVIVTGNGSMCFCLKLMKGSEEDHQFHPCCTSINTTPTADSRQFIDLKTWQI